MGENKEIFALIERLRTVIKYSSHRGGANLPEMFIICGLTEAEKTGKRLCISDIAEALWVTKSAASQMIDKFVERGVVRKYKDESNKKIVYIELTDDAKEICERKNRQYKEFINILSQRMGSDMDELIRLNTKFVDVMENLLKEIGDK